MGSQEFSLSVLISRDVCPVANGFLFTIRGKKNACQQVQPSLSLCVFLCVLIVCVELLRVWGGIVRYVRYFLYSGREYRFYLSAINKLFVERRTLVNRIRRAGIDEDSTPTHGSESLVQTLI